MSIATVSTIVIEAYSILFTTLNILDGLRIIGIVFGILAIIFFALATITMKDSWRVGIPEEKTSLISQVFINGVEIPHLLDSICYIFQYV